MPILIRNGTVALGEGPHRADVLVEGERVAAIGPSLDRPAATVIDAAGKLVLPGGVDVHTHIDMPLGGIRTADDFTSGTRAAARGGTTTVVDYATQSPGGSLAHALDEWMSRAAGRSVVDYGFHMGICDLRPEVELEMDEMVAAGVTSFKVFMAYPGRLMLDDGAIYRVLRRSAALGALVCVHAENGSVIDVLVAEALSAGRTGPGQHAATRPALVEAEAVARAISLAELARSPVYIVHLSSEAGLVEVSRGRGRGVPVYAETCPQYLFLSDDRYGRGGLEAARYVMSPPLRSPGSQDALWRGLQSGDVQVVATDHCPFMLAEKAAGLEDFSRIPNGAPGVEWRMLLVYQAVADGRLPLDRFVQVTATAPARLFGLYPRKGTIAIGSDADLVVLDPSGSTTVSAATHVSASDYDPYEGRVLRGAIETVLARGEVVVEGGRVVGRPGGGRFLHRNAV